MRYEAEIVICGAGTAGSVAAIAAADAEIGRAHV